MVQIPCSRDLIPETAEAVAEIEGVAEVHAKRDREAGFTLGEG